MYFAEYVMANKDRIFAMAEENARGDQAAATLYEEWERSEAAEDDMLNFYH